MSAQSSVHVHVLYAFINLAQVHNFTNRTRYFTFGRISVFIVSSGSNADNETFCTVVVVMVQKLELKRPEFESTCVLSFFLKIYIYSILFSPFITCIFYCYFCRLLTEKLVSSILQISLHCIQSCTLDM